MMFVSGSYDILPVFCSAGGRPAGNQTREGPCQTTGALEKLYESRKWKPSPDIKVLLLGVGDRGVLCIFLRCGARMGFLTRYDGELRESLVW